MTTISEDSTISLSFAAAILGIVVGALVGSILYVQDVKAEAKTSRIIAEVAKEEIDAVRGEMTEIRAENKMILRSLARIEGKFDIYDKKNWDK